MRKHEVDVQVAEETWVTHLRPFVSHLACHREQVRVCHDNYERTFSRWYVLDNIG